ncbi:hypothetical protein I4U23_003889 [Adineta vaga]|nr:hypothetical protein I4U23_003889 [Adineta vaga]
MSRHHFLGTTDVGITTSLLTSYNVPTKIPNGIQLNKMKQQDDMVLIELGTLLTSDECDDILSHVHHQAYEDMVEKYDIQTRNSARLIVMDDRLARTLWRRLKFNNKLTKLITNTRPLGFNVQGQWKLSGVNPAMRLNKYQTNQHFSPHKDAQYAPSGDERSLFSLIIYLNDNYEHGQTKFYFPKQTPTLDTKGLTIQEEINAYGGLQNGYECVTIQPKKGYAILFTHNLLHEAVAPQGIDAERFVLRSDVIVKREEKALGFAVCAEEEEDYFACLNFFREAQQRELDKSLDSGALYERSLSIRYCYPRLLQSKVKQTIVEEEEVLIDRLPSEIWLHIFGYVHEQDIRNLVFAYPQFQSLQLIWQAQQVQQLDTDPKQTKFIPKIHTQYGCQTLFRFSDADFFYQHVNACCRVAAVYAFFLLGHSKDSQTYTVRYDRNTQQTCEVNMEQLLADTFYNRNCYGSLYRVKQKDENKREPMIDLDHSVDRTYMTNRHQSQFIGQDLLSKFHIKIVDQCDSDSEMDYDGSITEEQILSYQRKNAVYDDNEHIVDRCLQMDMNNYSISTDEDDSDNEDDWNDGLPCTRDPTLDYREHLLEQIKHESGCNIFRMLLAKDHFIEQYCNCPLFHSDIKQVRDIIHVYNHLIFDFNTHQLTVERLPDEPPSSRSQAPLPKFARLLQQTISQGNPICYYRVNIEKLAEVTQGFNHASCQCNYPSVKVNEFSFLDYTCLFNVHLTVVQKSDSVFVLATYVGVAAL